MDRTEFLRIMRESLERKIPQAEIEENIRYYREYFEQSASSDEEVCEELGDPRLIAGSVIKAYLASKGPAAEQYTQEARREYSRMHGSGSFQEEDREGAAGGFLHKVMAGLVILAVIIVLAFLLRLALAILLPVLFVVILWKLIRGDR